MNFCATKFISLVAFEQLNRPTPSPAFRSVAARRPDAALSRASSQVAVRRPPLSRTIGSVSRVSPFFIKACFFRSAPSRFYAAARSVAGEPSGGDAIGVAVHVRAPVAHEPHQRHPEALGRLDRE